MKALTLWRPWSWAIVHGPKRIENRDWKPPEWLVGKRLLIHGGKTYDRDGATFIGERLREYGRHVPTHREVMTEGVLGACTVLGYMARKGDGFGFSTPEARAAFDADPLQGGWFFGEYGWVLGDVVAFPEPLACKGKQGLWEVTV